MSDEQQPWDVPVEGGVTRYGFQWGPMLVTRMCHITERGYSLEIATSHASMQVYVSEKGHKIKPMPVRRAAG